MAGPDWLDDKHTIYEIHEEAWKRNERRMQGGDAVLSELRTFDWETEDGDHHEARKAEATYINYPALFAETLVGHLFREAPAPDEGITFGGLGEVRGEEGDDPTRAQQLYFNADGVGNDASQWDNFWFTAERWAQATGHRWILAEASRVAPSTRADELRGQRPYLVEYSPLAVTNWYFREGQLQWAVIRPRMRTPKVEDGKLEGGDLDQGYLLMVRKGHEDLGQEFSAGGWWLYDPDKEDLDEGDWEKTEGEIPLFPLFAERSSGTEDRPAMSRPSTTELGQIAVALMNLSSAADYDAWEAAASILYFLGVDPDSFNTAVSKEESGNRRIPVPPHNQSGEVPQIHDGSTGTVTAEVFESRIKALLEYAEKIATMEASGSPDSSGRSKQMGFADVKAPRLAQLASELENAQNTALHFLEQRWGVADPSGQVSWPREFDLRPLVDDIREVFELEDLAGVRSPTVTAKGLTSAVREKGLASDEEDLEQIEDEYREAAERRDRESERARSFRDRLDDAVGNGGPPDDEEEEEEEPAGAGAGEG